MLTTLARMIRTGILTEPQPEPPARAGASEIDSLQQEIWRTLGRALAIRHVDAGSCNGCELEINAVNNPYYNLEGRGIHFVASPRHADLLLATGPVSVNMEEALCRTYEAMPAPKLVVAVGDCAECGGLFGAGYASRGGISSVIPVDHVIAGCPPAPAVILTGILRALIAAG